MTSPPKAIALLRVSSAAQAGPERHGLPTQRATCQSIAESHGLAIIEWVELEGVSGAAVLADTRFAALLRRLQSPEINAVIVAAFDRLFRRERFSDYAILDAFAETGTRLLTPDGELDLAAESGGLLGVIRGELAGMERRRIIDRTTAGRRRKRREKGVRAEGLVGMPRGVSFSHETQTWSYEWPEAEKIRQVFRLLLGGTHNLAEIHRRTGIGSPREPSSAILRVLRQPLYAGVYRVDRMWHNGRPRRLPENEIQHHEVLSPPLVSWEEFEETQRILARLRGSRPVRRDPETTPGTYGGHLICARCGAPMRFHPDPWGLGGYVCWRRIKKLCDMSQVSVRLADPRLDEQLESILGHEDTLAHLLEASTREAEAHASPSARELRRRLDEIERRHLRVKDGFEAGLYELQEAQKRTAGLDAERAEIEALMGVPGEEIEISIDLVSDLVEVFGSWSDLGRDEKRSLLRDYGAEIVVDHQGKPRLSWLRVDRLHLSTFPSYLWLYK